MSNTTKTLIFLFYFLPQALRFVKIEFSYIFFAMIINSSLFSPQRTPLKIKAFYAMNDNSSPTSMVLLVCFSFSWISVILSVSICFSDFCMPDDPVVFNRSIYYKSITKRCCKFHVIDVAGLILCVCGQSGIRCFFLFSYSKFFFRE